MVAGRPIPQAAFDRWTARIHPIAEETGASFFEATTAIAFADMAARGVDVAVVEVGLGGRLDSTNVLEPVVSVVTHIGLDHTEYLGSTLEAIAKEKAGIAKAGIPFLVGDANPGIAQVLAREATERGADVRRIPPEARYEGRVGLAGPHQSRNAAVAQAVLAALPGHLRPSPEAVERGFETAHLAGRFDRRGQWIFDVAHNPSGIDVLVESLAAARPPRPVHALVGILSDKDWGTMLERLRGAVDRGWLTVAPSAPPERRWDLEVVAKAVGRLSGWAVEMRLGG